MLTSEVFTILRVGASLLSEDGANREYDRAIVEFACDLLGIGADDRHVIDALMHRVAGRV